MKFKNINKERSKYAGPIFVMMEGIGVDITQSMARIVVNGKIFRLFQLELLYGIKGL